MKIARLGVLFGAGIALSAAAVASPIPGTAGAALFQDGPNAEGLYFQISVNYEAFNGQSASDPLGVTPGFTQYAYILEYIAGNENGSAYDVESIDQIPFNSTATTTHGIVNGVTSGTIAPSAHGVITLANGNPAARFLFVNSGDASFGPAGARSVILVCRVATSEQVGSVNASIRDSSLSDVAQVAGPVFEPGDEGCTPGYWKNHAERWPATHRPTDRFNTTFGVNVFSANFTLMDAARQGGGGAKALGRHAVAALLNAASSEVDYALREAQVILLVQQALAPGGDIEGTKDLLEQYNSSGCPL